MPAHATARNDDERMEVFLCHYGHDAEHLGPVDDEMEHCVKSIAPAPDNEERERNPCPQRRLHTPREERREEDFGSFLLLLFLFLLFAWLGSGRPRRVMRRIRPG